MVRNPDAQKSDGPGGQATLSPPSAHPLVELRDVRVRLGDRDILKGVNAELLRGRITALIGLNGCGKSTLLRAIVQEIPYTGQIKFCCGHDHSQPNPEHVGYVPQKLRVEASLPLTVLDLFGLALQPPALFLGVRHRVRLRVRQQLASVGVPHLIDAPVEKLSGGELQRVLLALALEPHPELLLLDEPAAGIDFNDVGRFHDLLQDINARTHVTILLVSHDLSVVSRMAHHVLCLQDGVIQCQGAPEEIVSREMLASIFGADKGLFRHQHDHSHGHPSGPDEK